MSANKKMVKISGAELGIEKGKPAIIRVGHQWLSTSPVVNYAISGGKVCIETKNTVYYS